MRKFAAAMIAILICTSPAAHADVALVCDGAIYATFAVVLNPMVLPSGDTVHGAQVGWTGEGCALVAVPPFAPPAGQQITGAPTYAIDGSGNVTETYATMPLPPPPPPSCQLWQLQAVMTPAQWSQVAAAVAALGDPAVTAFFARGTDVVPASSTTLIALGAQLGMTPAQVTALVQQASGVSIP